MSKCLLKYCREKKLDSLVSHKATFQNTCKSVETACRLKVMGKERIKYPKIGAKFNCSNSYILSDHEWTDSSTYLYSLAIISTCWAHQVVT